MWMKDLGDLGHPALVEVISALKREKPGEGIAQNLYMVAGLVSLWDITMPGEIDCRHFLRVLRQALERLEEPQRYTDAEIPSQLLAELDKLNVLLVKNCPVLV